MILVPRYTWQQKSSDILESIQVKTNVQKLQLS